MIGHPKHVKKALDAGVDIICAQGGEGGGHTGSCAAPFVFIHLIFSVPTSILIPEVVALCEGRKSSLNGQPIYVVAAGGIYNGKSLAAALMYTSQIWHTLTRLGSALKPFGSELASSVQMKPAHLNPTNKASWNLITTKPSAPSSSPAVPSASARTPTS